ncbi:Transmembrane protein 191C [Fukomys damarensis]|uniref:Transmembrane protein 191C n=1 Tax=Fukomys damarensis TaxID=885580 RepID=A0A091DUT7_FUKDA|nr:Transmembrane protein 191C [Fukomys damarensis]
MNGTHETWNPAHALDGSLSPGHQSLSPRTLDLHKAVFPPSSMPEALLGCALPSSVQRACSAGPSPAGAAAAIFRARKERSNRQLQEQWEQLSSQEKQLFGGGKGSGRLRLWTLGALRTLALLPLVFLVLQLLYLVLVKPEAIRQGLARLRSDAAFRRLRYTLSPLLELRGHGLLPA